MYLLEKYMNLKQNSNFLKQNKINIKLNIKMSS